VWLTYLRIDTTAGELTHDLAVDVSGLNAPSPVQAGLAWPPSGIHIPDGGAGLWPWALAALLAAAVLSGSGRLLSNRP
jgi:hypothetical protein